MSAGINRLFDLAGWLVWGQHVRNHHRRAVQEWPLKHAISNGLNEYSR